MFYFYTVFLTYFESFISSFVAPEISLFNNLEDMTFNTETISVRLCNAPSVYCRRRIRNVLVTVTVTV